MGYQVTNRMDKDGGSFVGFIGMMGEQPDSGLTLP